MHYYGYKTFENDTKKLIEQSREYQPDTIVAIARGGMMLGQLMGYGLSVRNVQSIHVESYDDEYQRESVTIFGDCDLKRSERILVVDDIVDSGKTLQAILKYFKKSAPHAIIKSASLFYKHSAVIQPDYTIHEATEWINFFWEADYA